MGSTAPKAARGPEQDAGSTPASSTLSLGALLSDPHGPAQHEHRGARHEHAITRDPLTGDYEVHSTHEGTSPYLASLDEHTAAVKAAGCPVPEGYVVELVEAKHDPAAWTRTAQGEDAVTVAVWRCRYRVLRDPRQRLDRVAAHFTERKRRKARHGKGPQAAVFVAPAGDLQAGKIDGGGTDALVSRYADEVERTVNRYGDLCTGAPVVLPQLGDCIEGNVSQGGAVKGRSDLPIDAQVEVYARLLEHTVDAYLHAGAPSVLVPAVPGNHDETSRQAGKLDTSFSSSWALLAVRLLARIYRKDERVTFLLPDPDTMTVTVELGGMVVALAHGHQFRGGFEKWWQGQAAGRTRPGDADLLLAGHLHHLRVQDFGGGRTFLQVPALDGGSQWWTEASGDQTRSRAVSFVIRDGRVHDLDPVS